MELSQIIGVWLHTNTLSQNTFNAVNYLLKQALNICVEAYADLHKAHVSEDPLNVALTTCWGFSQREA